MFAATHRPSTVDATQADLDAVQARDAMERDVDAASAISNLFVGRDRLATELRRLDRLHRASRCQPRRFAQTVRGRQGALSLWLYGVAVGVAAQGLHDTALALLDLLPGIAAGAAGRRELLCDLIAAGQRESLADVAVDSFAQPLPLVA